MSVDDGADIQEKPIEEVTFKEFLESCPPGVQKQIRYRESNAPILATEYLTFPELELYCDGVIPSCNQKGFNV